MFHQPKKRLVSPTIRANEARLCSVEGCTNHRFKLSPFCEKHYATVKRTGHPQGVTPDPHQLKWERSAVAELFSTNPHHPGLTRALSHLKDWTHKASSEAHHGNHWQLEVDRVVRHGVSHKDILIEVCAAWSWLQRFPHKAPSDKALWFVLGHAVLKLAPRGRILTERNKATGTRGYIKKAHWRSLNDVGQYLQAVLAPLMVNVHAAISCPDVALQAALEDYRAPFQANPKAMAAATAA